jgi:hypothetical protein
MTDFCLPELKLADWRSSRDTIHKYTGIAGNIREKLSPKQKHWWHVTLQATALGLSTTPVAAGNGYTFEIVLDFIHHRLCLTSSNGNGYETVLEGQSARSLSSWLFEMLSTLDVTAGIELSDPDAQTLEYDSAAVTRYWQVLAWVDAVFKRFRAGLRTETSPVQVFPHHFDLAMSWFSGRFVPGVAPADWEAADEQLTFGFLSGDQTIPDAYFYITAYPFQEVLMDTRLPEKAYWHTGDFTGAVMTYETLRRSKNPEMLLLTFLRTVQNAAAQIMQ